MKHDNHSFEAFMDGTDFYYEEGRPIEGNRIFADVDDLIEKNECLEECGIVKVRVEFLGWEREPEKSKEEKQKGKGQDSEPSRT